MNLQFAPASQGVDERWKMMLTLVQFTGVHLPDINLSSYDNLNNMRLYRFKCVQQAQI